MSTDEARDILDLITAQAKRDYSMLVSDGGGIPCNFVGSVKAALKLTQNGYAVDMSIDFTSTEDSFMGAERSEVEHTLEHFTHDVHTILTRASCRKNVPPAPQMPAALALATFLRAFVPGVPSSDGLPNANDTADEPYPGYNENYP